MPLWSLLVQGNPLVSSLQTGSSGVDEHLMLGAAGRASEMGGMLQGGCAHYFIHVLAWYKVQEIAAVSQLGWHSWLLR